MAGGKNRYSPWVKEQVRLRYRFCRTTEDKEALALELGIVDDDGKPDVNKLYNLASRLGATQDEDVDVTQIEQRQERLREDPATTVFSPETDRYLKAEFGRKAIGVIAYHLHHSETAVMYRARKLGKRKPVRIWDARKVALWLGLSLAELHALSDEGVDIHVFCNRAGRIANEVVTTSSLKRWIDVPENLARVKARGADGFFLLELQEIYDGITDNRPNWERCKFLNHGHVCMNPYADTYGMFCTNGEGRVAGDDPQCEAKRYELDDLRGEEVIFA
jgi:hypothetical protein